MDLTVLDENLRDEHLINDEIVSCIWTERRQGSGEIQLTVPPSRKFQNLLRPGARLAMAKSSYIMEIDTSDLSQNDDGEKVLSVVGYSLEEILKTRVNRRSFYTSGDAPAKDMIHDFPPVDMIHLLFNLFIRNNTYIPEDNFPFLAEGTIGNLGSIPAFPDSVEINFPIQSVYDSIFNVAELYDLGVRIVRDRDTSNLYFEVFTGDDRTSSQSTFDSVIFSEALGTLSATRELYTTKDYRNVAYVFGQNGSEIVFADYVDDTISGFERRPIFLDLSSEITTVAGTALSSELIRRGQLELAKYRAVSGFDGEIPPNLNMRYGIDYNLGDLVEKRNSLGTAANMRVSEQIFVVDGEGEREYPTLTQYQLITPGSWSAWSANQVWDDADGYWEDA